MHFTLPFPSAFDYTPIRITKTLESASTDPMCASFPIQNDDIIEETENFFITLTGVGSINVVTGSATVLILDDDGMIGSMLHVHIADNYSLLR